MTARGDFEVAINAETLLMKLHRLRHRHQAELWCLRTILRSDADETNEDKARQQ
jgi:hypothetical protein